MKKLTIIKLGGSVITDKNKVSVLRLSAVKRLSREVSCARKGNPGVDFIIVHGAGSFGHPQAKKYQTAKGIVGNESLRGFSLVSNSVRQLHFEVLKEMVKAKLNVASFPPQSFVYSNNDGLKSVFSLPLLKALKLGIIPVFFGDVVFDEKKGFCIYSGERSIGVISKILSKSHKIKIVMASDVDGVLDEDRKVITRINKGNFKQAIQAVKVSVSDVTGGMEHKIEESIKLYDKYGIETLIVNGNKPQRLYRALSGESVTGTTIGS